MMAFDPLAVFPQCRTISARECQFSETSVASDKSTTHPQLLGTALDESSSLLKLLLCHAKPLRPTPLYNIDALLYVGYIALKCL